MRKFLFSIIKNRVFLISYFRVYKFNILKIKSGENKVVISITLWLDKYSYSAIALFLYSFGELSGNVIIYGPLNSFITFIDKVSL